MTRPTDPFVSICSVSSAVNSPCQVVAIPWKGEENEKEASRIALAEATKWSLQKKKILWDLDLFFTEKHNVMEDEVLFHSRRVLVEYFGETCLSTDGIETFGVNLYTGSVDFENSLIWTENIEDHYIELLQERKLEKSSYEILWKRGYALEILAEYLHKLGSYLHDDIPLFCSLDVSCLKSPSEVLYLLSKERFQHVELILKGCALPIGAYSREFGLGSRGGWDVPEKKPGKITTIGLVNPTIDAWCDQTVKDVNSTVSQLENNLIDYRIANESTLTEEWDGLEILIVIGNSLTVSCKRKLQGYLASGGEIVLVGNENIPSQRLLGIEYTEFTSWIGGFKRKSE